ncbi:flagellar assembly protein FliW [Paenibacillus sp. MB22_1]|uniref:flagellar assembly protein FliW n=1 Tax=Paenibacillus sp. MB22_1 TaxID=3383121 RepID=UPI0039A369B0
MRQVESSIYGMLDVKEQQIYRFEPGIAGLPDIKEYALFPMDGTPFFVLHALEEEVNFILLPAHQAVSDYSFQLNDEVVEMLGLESAEDVAVMVVVNVTPEQLFVNLLAPILLAPNSLKGCQYIIKDQELPIRHPLLQKEGP